MLSSVSTGYAREKDYNQIQQSSNKHKTHKELDTIDEDVKYRIKQEIKYLYQMKQQLKNLPYQMHLQLAE